MSTDLRVAQTVACGPWVLAFGIDWANAIVDEFELVNIPRAPHWLIGAVNVDGSIVPVVDLALYLDPQALIPGTVRQQRLLLGGRHSGRGEAALAFRFSGLPFQIQYQPMPLPVESGLPERLHALCSGLATGADGALCYEIDATTLSDQLALALLDV